MMVMQRLGTDVGAWITELGDVDWRNVSAGVITIGTIQ